jgi:hypothetical protein
MNKQQYKILFKNGRLIEPEKLIEYVNKFSGRYYKAINEITSNSITLNEKTFKQNVTILLRNFNMTRGGKFKGLQFNKSGSTNKNKTLKNCWGLTKRHLQSVKRILEKRKIDSRERTLISLDRQTREQIIAEIWIAFKKLLPITMGKHSYGLVGASKILFAVFPEIVLPVDNTQWVRIFKTVDMGDVIREMTDEIIEWEKQTKKRLDELDYSENKLTLPAIYNVMAMRARPIVKGAHRVRS